LDWTFFDSSTVVGPVLHGAFIGLYSCSFDSDSKGGVVKKSFEKCS